MITILEKSQCCGCSACEQICPKKCITMKQDIEGFEYPFIDKNICIDCGLCEKICPIKNEKKIENDLLECYVAYIRDEHMRLQSSSGGLFTAVSEKILEEGGVVFGAAFDENFLVHHIGIENIEDLSELRGSKYLQSRIENTYEEARQFLNSGRLVLYSGTTCQIAGLKNYLCKDYKNLYTIDILCHGVPSPKLWKRYIEYKEKQHKSVVKSIYFRSKSLGWKEFSMRLIFNNLMKYERRFKDDDFMKLFLSDICLRPSCHNCKFKELSRPADITLGDCWGIENYMPNMDDDKGTSVVLIHSENGNVIFDSLKDKIIYCKAEVDKALPPTADSRKSVKKHPKREVFFKKLDKDVSISRLIKLVELNLISKIKRRMKSTINRFILKLSK